jgi:tetratricopeptide (TPR) repeat protein
MRYFFVFFFFCLFSIHFSFSQTQYEMGVASYDSAQYSKAIEHWEEWSKEYPTAAVFYNLGNAWFRMGDKTNALVNYYRAFQLQPHNEDVRYNILFLGGMLPSDILSPEPAFWFGPDQWLILSLALLFLVSLFVLGVYLSPNQRIRKFFFGLGIVSFVFGLTSIGLGLSHSHWLSRKWAVVKSQSANIHSEPSTNAMKIFSLEQGVLLEVTSNSTDFLKVKFQYDKIGWIAAEHVEII